MNHKERTLLCSRLDRLLFFAKTDKMADEMKNFFVLLECSLILESFYKTKFKVFINVNAYFLLCFYEYILYLIKNLFVKRDIEDFPNEPKDN